MTVNYQEFLAAELQKATAGETTGSAGVLILLQYHQAMLQSISELPTSCTTCASTIARLQAAALPLSQTVQIHLHHIRSVRREDIKTLMASCVSTLPLVACCPTCKESFHRQLLINFYTLRHHP